MAGSLAADAEKTSQPAEEPVDVRVFQAATIEKHPALHYPVSESMNGNEGRVRLNFMIDKQGKPYEIAVVDSVGGPAFEKNTIQIIEKSTFKPAMRGGTPIDSGFTLNFRYYMDEPAKSASRSWRC